MFGKKEKELIINSTSIEKMSQALDVIIHLSKEREDIDRLKSMQKTICFLYPKTDNEAEKLDNKIKNLIDDLKIALMAKNVDVGKKKQLMSLLERTIIEREAKN